MPTLFLVWITLAVLSKFELVPVWTILIPLSMFLLIFAINMCIGTTEEQRQLKELKRDIKSTSQE
tara:strand:- start:1071 stop:1265 length:195 start_codon:yes stop_codon:yes gene_type:complete